MSNFIGSTFTVIASSTSELAKRIEEELRKHPSYTGERQRFRVSISALGSRDLQPGEASDWGGTLGPETPDYD